MCKCGWACIRADDFCENHECCRCRDKRYAEEKKRAEKAKEKPLEPKSRFNREDPI
jgi:5-methylcytosine-specific restriction endonuclease McrA